MLEQLGPVFAALVVIGLVVAFVVSMWRASKRPDNPKKDDRMAAPGDNSWSGDSGSGAVGGD
jgi:hypothetical protein